MPPAKYNLTMDKTTGLISSLFDVASSCDVPFHQPQYVHIIQTHASSAVLYRLSTDVVLVWKINFRYLNSVLIYLC